MTRPTRGFTLPEVLMAIALVSAFAAAAAPVLQSFRSRSDLDSASFAVAASLRRARALAEAGEGDSAWGVKVGEGVTVFKGQGYEARDPNFDEHTELPRSVSAAGANEFTFSKGIGLPSATGTVSLSTGSLVETREVVVNGLGSVFR